MKTQGHIRIGAPPLSKRGRWLSRSVAAGAAAALVASPLALLALPAGASGPAQISLVAGYSGSQTVSPGTPQAASSARLSASYVAQDPANGDEVVASAENGYVYVVTPSATSESATDFGLGSSGTLTGSEAYAVGGNGTGFAYNSGSGVNAGTLVGHPGSTSGEGGSASAVATSNSVVANSVAFDPNGNILLAGSSGQGPSNPTIASAVQVIARTTGTFYGVAMTAGDLYTVADVGLNGAPSTAVGMGGVIVGGFGVTTDSQGDVFVGADYGLDMVNFGSSTLHLYGATENGHSSTTIAGSTVGSAVCSSGPNSFPATTPGGSAVYYNNTAAVVDASGNVYLTDNESPAGGVAGTGCVWALPAQSGTLLGQSVTAGDAYKVAGNGGTSATPDGTAAVDANVGTTAAVSLDAAGNVVLAEEGGAGTGVSPAVQVVAETTGSFYGTSMNAGDVYTLSGGASASSTTVPGNAAGFVLHGASSVASDGHGDLFFTDQGSNGTDPGTGNVYEITGGPLPAPIIGQQPTDEAGFTGGSVTFTASAGGTPAPTVQWMFETPGSSSFTDVPGNATSDTLTVSALTEAESGTKYEAVFSNSAGQVTSNVATLSVYTLIWKAPKPILYGTALSSLQLNAVVKFGGLVKPGTITYNPAAGSVLNAGNDTLSLSFTATGADASASASVPITVEVAKPTLTWATPDPILFGTALSGTQLDATATAIVGGNVVTVPGTFVYTPAAGTIPKVGGAKLGATFTPSSPNFFSGATKQGVVVNPLPDSASVSISPSTVAVGSEQLAVITVNVTANETTPYPPVGKVTVSAGAVPLCTIVMAGVGSCVVSSESLLAPSGTPYAVTAGFASSNKEFAATTSPPANLTVTN